jgi:hypothetical protein
MARAFFIVLVLAAGFDAYMLEYLPPWEWALQSCISQGCL